MFETYLGNSLDVIPSLSGIGAVITDPPYGMAYKGGGPKKMCNGMSSKSALWSNGDVIEGDLTTDARDRCIEACIDRFGDIPMLVFGTWKIRRPTQTRQVLVWDKGGALGMGALDIPWKPDHEEMYVIGRGWSGKRDCGSVVHCPPVQSTAKNGRLHPTQKPVELVKKILKKLPKDITVLDPFMGSGTTGIACLEMGNRFVGIECVEGYFDIANKRLEEAACNPALL